MFGIDYKKWIAEAVAAKMAEYLVWLKVSPSWEKTVIGYADAKDKKFDAYFEQGLCNHPKRMYRPGNTVIVHFTQISPHLVTDYEEGRMTGEDWEKLCLDTRQVARGITDGVISTLQAFGREVSLLPESENWSHVCGAEVANLGTFEKKEDMIWKDQAVGYMGAVITEVPLKS
ncbi:MAG: hypothetical protein RR131_01280 [Anaerovorax sp.]